jgi:hypothetical protein
MFLQTLLLYVNFDEDRVSAGKCTGLRQGKKERSKGKDRFQLNTPPCPYSCHTSQRLFSWIRYRQSRYLDREIRGRLILTRERPCSNGFHYLVPLISAESRHKVKSRACLKRDKKGHTREARQSETLLGRLE